MTNCQTDNDRGTDRNIDNDIWTEDQTENDSRTDIGNVTDEDDTPTDKDGDSYNSLILTCEFFLSV